MLRMYQYVLITQLAGWKIILTFTSLPSWLPWRLGV